MTDRTAYREAIAQIAANAHAKLPDCAGRIDAAVKLVLLGEVTLHADGASVGSCTDPTKSYTVNGTCTCQDYTRAPGNLCKHRLAYGIARRVGELLPPTVETAAPLPEAPASVNVRLLIAGYDTQLTLRGTSEDAVLDRLRRVLSRNDIRPVPKTQPRQGRK